MGITRAEEDARGIARVREFLADTYGENPFVIADAAHEFAINHGPDADDWYFGKFCLDVRRYIKAVISEFIDGHPRYMWLVSSRPVQYQLSSAVEIEYLDKDLVRDNSFVESFLAREAWVLKLKAAKQGITIDTLLAEHPFRDQLEELFASS